MQSKRKDAMLWFSLLDTYKEFADITIATFKNVLSVWEI